MIQQNQDWSLKGDDVDDSYDIYSRELGDLLGWKDDLLFTLYYTDAKNQAENKNSL